MKLNKLVLITYGLAMVVMIISRVTTNAQSIPRKDILTLSASIGYQQENFNWSIAGDTDGNNPNIYSELKWTRLQSPMLQLDLGIRPWKNLILKTSFNSGSITSGSVNDRDYLGDDRTLNVYDGTYKSNKGLTQSAELIAGYTLRADKVFSITPQFGYGFYRQHLFILGDVNTNQKLRSTYTINWHGLIIGFESQIKASGNFSIEPGFLYSQLVYKSVADWNLIEKFNHPISFEHHANAYKLEATTKFRYTINEQFSIYIQTRYSYWKTGKGTDTLYLADGTISLTRFNGANRNSIYCGLGVTWSPF